MTQLLGLVVVSRLWQQDNGCCRSRLYVHSSNDSIEMAQITEH